MAVDIPIVAIQIYSLILLTVSAYLSYVIYKFNRLSKGWLGVTLAISISPVRIFVGILGNIYDLSSLSPVLYVLDRGLITALIATLLIVGLWSMKKNFESFEIIEKKVKEKVKSFDKLRKKRK